MLAQGVHLGTLLSLSQGARLLLLGAIVAVFLRSVWEISRYQSDRMIQLSAVWTGFVSILIGCRVWLDATPSLSGGTIQWLVRLEYFTALTPIPALLAIVLRNKRGYGTIGKTLVGATMLTAGLVWIDGAMLRSEIITRETLLGATYTTLAPGPMLPWVGLGAALAGTLAVLTVRPSLELADRDTRMFVPVGVALLVPAGINDSLMDAGVIRSIRLVDTACLVTLVVVGFLLARRSRLAFSGARARIETQTLELERHNHELGTAERRATLGTLSAGIGHEINNPMTVLTINLQAAEALLGDVPNKEALGPAKKLKEAHADATTIVEAIRHLGRDPEEEQTNHSRPSRHPEGRLGTNRLRILVVDDEPVVARALQRLLREHDVTLAADPREALESARRYSVDLILCDAMMPEMSGPEFLRALRSENLLGDARFAFVTGGAFAPDVARAIQSLRLPVLHKPIDKKELDACIATVLHGTAKPRAAPNDNG